jgi:phosphoribosylformimino-5-aminoimidazole carboxamide ribotide isomerase
MTIYPAIDLLGGRCVRLKQGDFSKVSVFNEDPASQALEWQSQGASFLHVVDLDGARTGSASNNRAISSIISAVSIPIQVGGGIRTIKGIEEKLSMGVNRVILGTAAIKAPNLVKEAVERFGADRIVVGVDARDGFASASGWLDDSPKDALELCRELAALGARICVYTDIAKDGMMQGPSIDATKRVADGSGLQVIASGGISSYGDLDRVKEIGACGAIIGQALYIGAISLREAVNAYEKDNPLP